MINNYNQGYNQTSRMYHSSCSIKNESDGGAEEMTIEKSIEVVKWELAEYRNRI